MRIAFFHFFHRPKLIVGSAIFALTLTFPWQFSPGNWKRKLKMGFRYNGVHWKRISSSSMLVFSSRPALTRCDMENNYVIYTIWRFRLNCNQVSKLSMESFLTGRRTGRGTYERPYRKANLKFKFITINYVNAYMRNTPVYGTLRFAGVTDAYERHLSMIEGLIREMNCRGMISTPGLYINLRICCRWHISSSLFLQDKIVTTWDLDFYRPLTVTVRDMVRLVSDHRIVLFNYWEIHQETCNQRKLFCNSNFPRWYLYIDST